MPHFNVIIGSDGPVFDLGVAVSRSWRQVAVHGVAVPPPITVRALIDTGSDLSVVHPRILQQFSTGATGSIRIRRPGTGTGFRVAWLSDVEFLIGGISPHTHWIPTSVVGVAPSTPTVLAMIGRDVLEHCTLFYNGPRAELSISC